jgi:UMF1 family MFS transporter
MPGAKPSASTSKQSGDQGWLAALGLHRKELRAWALYDWANSAFATTVIAAVLPIFYFDVAADGLAESTRTAYWAYTDSVALLFIAVLSPILGAAADYLGAKKRFLATFLAGGIVATAMLFFIQRGGWLYASLVFIVGQVGFAGGNVFYESLLPHIARSDEVDRVSAAGYAIGYLGGGVLLAINAAWLTWPQRFGIADREQAARLSFLSVAVWWLVFSMPLFRWVAEPPRRLEHDERARMNPLVVAFGRLAETFRALRRHRQVFLFLLAFWLYIDGIGTIIKMAVIYGAYLDIDREDLIGALLLVQFAGIPFTFAFGALAGRIGPKNGICLALAVYALISVFGYFMQAAWQFWVLAICVAAVQGGAQALSRSLYTSMIPQGKSSEFFGFFSVSSKFAGIIGPALFGVVSQLTGDSRYGILFLVPFFAGGIILLSMVNVAEGQRVAKQEDAEMVLARERNTAGGGKTGEKGA